MSEAITKPEIFVDGAMTAVCGRIQARRYVTERGGECEAERCVLCRGRCRMADATRDHVAASGLAVRVVCYPCWNRAGRPSPPEGFATSAAQRAEAARLTGDAQAVEKVAAKLGTTFRDTDKEN